MFDIIKAGKQIAHLRKQKNTTQEELAQRLSVTPQAISKWENGHTMPEVSLLIELAQILEVSIDNLLLPDNTLAPNANFEHILLPYAEIADFSGKKWPRSMSVPAIIAAIKVFMGLESHKDFQNRQINDDTEYILQSAFTSLCYGYSWGRTLSEIKSLPTLGLNCEVYHRSDYSKTEIIRLAKQNLMNGYPVVIEPTKYTDTILATGFSNNGRVLKGHAFLDGDDDKNFIMSFQNLQTFSNWYHENVNLILIRPSSQKTTIEAACIAALKEGYHLLSNQSHTFDNPLVGYGLVIYDNWCTELQKEHDQNLETINCISPHIFIHYESKLRIRQFLELCLHIIKKIDQPSLSKAIVKYAEILELCEKVMPNLLTEKPKDLWHAKSLRQSFVYTLQRSRELEVEALTCWMQALRSLS